MTIHINTDNAIKGTENMVSRMQAAITDKLDRYREFFTDIDVHLTDESGRAPSNLEDKRCVLRANFRGGAPEVVTGIATTLDLALTEAINKMRNALESRTGKMRNH